MRLLFINYLYKETHPKYITRDIINIDRKFKYTKIKYKIILERSKLQWLKYKHHTYLSVIVTSIIIILFLHTMDLKWDRNISTLSKIYKEIIFFYFGHQLLKYVYKNNKTSIILIKKVWNYLFVCFFFFHMINVKKFNLKYLLK